VTLVYGTLSIQVRNPNLYVDANRLHVALQVRT